MKITLVFFIGLVFFSCAFAQENTKVNSDSLVNLAKRELGVTYKYGTSNPGVSFDCSGFVYYVYNSFNIKTARSSKDFAMLGEKVALKDCRKGDCIIFRGTSPGSKTAGHVGIVIENNKNGIQFIHSSSSKNHNGVIITDYYTSEYPKRFLDVRRLF